MFAVRKLGMGLLAVWWMTAPMALAQQPSPAHSLPETVVEESSPGAAAPTISEGDVVPEEGVTISGITMRGAIPWSSDLITNDSDRVGPYNQPAWTTQRPFSASRAYVLPAGTAQLEQWARPTWERSGKPNWRMLEELAIGLPGRFQLDIYERWHIKENGSGNQQADHEGNQIELRWALANWGVIPLNPTLYGEWVQRGNREDEPDKYELKLLLSDELLPNLFYASNLILEQDVGGEKETELGWSNALGVPIIQRKLLAGVEMYWQQNTVHGERGDPIWSFVIGPSMQYRPTNRTYINFVPLFGTTSQSPYCQAYLIFGCQFGFRAGPATAQGFAPSSTIGN